MVHLHLSHFTRYALCLLLENLRVVDRARVGMVDNLGRNRAEAMFLFTLSEDSSWLILNSALLPEKVHSRYGRLTTCAMRYWRGIPT